MTERQMTYREQINTIRYMMTAVSAFLDGAEIPQKPEQIEWTMIYALAKKHSITSLTLAVYRKLAENETELLSHWERENAVLNAKYLAQKLEFESLKTAFEKEKISYLPLKGFKLKLLYPSPELREMSDLDICVNPEDFDTVASLLINSGYKLDHAGYVHNAYIKPPFIELELHRILFEGKEDFRVSSCPLKYEGNPYHRTFTAQEELIFMLLHMKKHDNSGGCGIRSVIDFYLFINKQPELLNDNVFKARLKEENIEEFYNLLLGLSYLWFKGEAASDELLEFELYTVLGGTYGTLTNYIERSAEKKGVKFYFSRLFPSISHMKKRYPVLKKYLILLPFLYILRLIQSLFNGAVFHNVSAIRHNSKIKDEKNEYKNEIRDNK